MPPAVSAVELRRRGASADQLDVHDSGSRRARSAGACRSGRPGRAEGRSRERRAFLAAQAGRAHASKPPSSTRCPPPARRSERAGRVRLPARRGCLRRRCAGSSPSAPRGSRRRPRRRPRRRGRAALRRRAAVSDGRQLVDAGARFLRLAIGVPRDEEQAADDDEDRGADSDPGPDVPEDHDCEHAGEQEQDRGASELEGVSIVGESTLETGHDQASVGALAARVRQQADEITGCVFCAEAAGELTEERVARRAPRRRRLSRS